MPIKIVKEGDDLYTAEVTPPHGIWKSPHPLPNVELDSKLFRKGYDILEIDRAFLEVGVVHSPENTYRYAAKITRPFLQAALAGERNVPEQKPFIEAWLVDPLIYDRMLSLERVIAMADAINHAIPNYDEISWAFLRLRRRGWLSIEGDMYGLTLEGRLAIQDILSKGGDSKDQKILEKWLSNNPPLGDKRWSANIRRMIRF